MADENLIRAITAYGDYYRTDYLSSEGIRPITSEQVFDLQWEALMFLFRFIFYQGRADVISRRVEDKATLVLRKHFNLHGFHWFESDLVDTASELAKVIGKGHVGKARDNEMIIAVLKYVMKLPDQNITKYVLSSIQGEEIQKLSQELQNLRQIGPKIASLYLRDFVSLFQLESRLTQPDLSYVMPIDTWVAKVFGEVIGQSLSTSQLSERQMRSLQHDMAAMCWDRGLSAISFNQGAWYIGARAYDIVINAARRNGLPC